MATILITGCSKGIGMSAALIFARAGHQVAATMRNPTNARELHDVAVKEKLPIRIFKLDVDSDESVSSTVERITKEMGFIDVLINNAGIERSGAIEETQLLAFRAVMETNYFGVIRCVQAVLPLMRKQGKGCIINVASVAGRVASAAMAPYSASKFALESFSEILAQEVKALGIRVAIVEPGIIDTPMAQHITVITLPASNYSHQLRLAALFTASLKRPVSPTIVADKMLEIVETGTLQLRHLVGPDAIPFVNWRQSMNDEAWINLA
ncbi:MAG TPA: SDR family oxidoreductase, partial [Chryseolinea sp.]|nr:SDR family oxidoreductase [Chryseolinea sp.]